MQSALMAPRYLNVWPMPARHAPTARARSQSDARHDAATVSRVDFVVFDLCFGRLHYPAPDTAVARGVVLCNAFGHEGLAASRAMLELATLLADAGMPVLRFDYPGTGDSAGVPEPGQIERWADSVAAAARFLRDTCGVEEIVLCGLRMGALVALLAADRVKPAVAGLAMLAPPESGKAMLREMTMQRRLLGTNGGRTVADGGDEAEFHGFPLFSQDREALTAIAPVPLLQLLHGCRRLVMGNPHWQDAACEVVPFDGLSALMRSAELSEAPTEDFKKLVGWIGKDAGRAAPNPVVQTRALMPLDDADEAFMAIGEDRSAFGVLSTARRSFDGPATPAVLLINTGATPHIGHARLAVEISRGLAASGITALRIDTSGLGDSTMSVSTPPSSDWREAARARVFHSRCRRDVRDAVSLLAEAGHAPIVLVGICSGASLALEAAANDARVAAALLVNLPDFSPVGKRGSASAMGVSLSRIVVGRIRRHLGAALASRLARLGKNLGQDLHRFITKMMGRGGAGQLLNPALTILHRLAKRGVAMRFVYDAADPGLVKLTSWLGSDTSCRVVHGAGHVFAGRADRKLLFEELTDLITKL